MEKPLLTVSLMHNVRQGSQGNVVIDWMTMLPFAAKHCQYMSIVDTRERDLELMHWLYWDETGNFSPEICFRIWNVQV